jgi:hypothetical protein
MTILGQELAVTFNMAVQIEFEDLSGLAFDLNILGTQKATMMLCYAALKVANGKVPFTFEEMVSNITVEETAELKNAVIEAMNKWFKIPEVIGQQPKEEGEKN